MTGRDEKLVEALRVSLKETERLRALKLEEVAAAHGDIASCAIVPIFPNATGAAGVPPMGLFAIHAREPWFFTRSRACSLESIGTRLSILIDAIRQGDAALRADEFLAGMTPPHGGVPNRLGSPPVGADRVRVGVSELEHRREGVEPVGDVGVLHGTTRSTSRIGEAPALPVP